MYPRRMATRVLQVCDVCGTPTDSETVRFGWGMTTYEADLCGEHAEELIGLMERMVLSARPLGAPASPVDVPRQPVPPRQQATTAEVRAWAKKKNIKVPDRGRLPDDLFEKYLSSRGGNRSS
jgi:hypothetical protein